MRYTSQVSKYEKKQCSIRLCDQELGVQILLWWTSSPRAELSKDFVHFLEEMRTRQFAFEIFSKIEGSNTSRLEAHVDFFKLLMKGIFGPYVCTVNF